MIEKKYFKTKYLDINFNISNVLIKEKSDGIQVNTLSMFDEFSNCQIKAEYIEEHEIYLIFDSYEL